MKGKNEKCWSCLLTSRHDQHLSHTLTHMQWNLKIPSWGAAPLKRRCLAASNLSAPQVQNVEMYVQLFLIISRPQLWFQLLLYKGSAKSINYSVDHFLATKNFLFFLFVYFPVSSLLSLSLSVSVCRCVAGNRHEICLPWEKVSASDVQKHL